MDSIFETTNHNTILQHIMYAITLNNRDHLRHLKD